MSTRGGLRLRSPGVKSDSGTPVVAPFTGGMVTEVGIEELLPNQSPNLQDVIFPNKIAGFRGSPVAAGPLNTHGVSICGVAVTDEIPPATIGTNVYHYGYDDGTTANSLGGSTAPLLSSAKRIPYVVFQNEILWFAQDGISPIQRTTSAPIANLLSQAGTISGAVGTTTITGSGTSFLGYNGVGVYLACPPGIPASQLATNLVVRSSSDTSLSIATPLVYTQSGASYTASAIGVIGLSTVVTDTGVASISGTTYTGQGTYWAHSGPGFGAVAVGDSLGIKGQAFSVNPISAVTNDTTLTTLGGTGTNAPYRIHRNLVGTHGCVHNGRLIVVGCAWQRRRVYYTPLVSSTQVAGLGEIPWTLGDITNGNVSYTVQASGSNVCDYVDVPNANAEGAIVAVASTASGILVLATDGAYLISGDFPTETITNLSPGSDCTDARSVVVAKGSVFWAGSQGIFQFTGGRVVDITAGKRNTEWRATAAGYAGVCVGYFIKNHYCLSLGIHPTTTWVYDAIHQVWCGNHTTTALAACTLTDQDEAYIIPYVLPASQQAMQMHNVFLDPGQCADANAVFIADLPPSAAGDAVTWKRVTQAIVRLSASGTVTVQSSMDGLEWYTSVVYNTDATITGTGITHALTTRIRPVTDSTQSPTGALGQRGRKFQMRITCAQPQSGTIRVFEIKLFPRTFAANR